MPLKIIYAYWNVFKLRTIESAMKRKASTIVSLFNIPSLERPLFLLQYELFPAVPPARAAPRPSLFESCIITITTIAIQIKR